METAEISIFIRRLGHEFDQQIRLLEKMMILVMRLYRLLENDEYRLYARLSRERVELLNALYHHRQHFFELIRNLAKIKTQMSPNLRLDIEIKIEQVATILRQITSTGNDSQFEVTPIIEA